MEQALSLFIRYVIIWCLALFCGFALTVYIGAHCPVPVKLMGDPLFYVEIFFAASAGIFMRFCRRRIFFGKNVSFHTSAALEIVEETARFLNPFIWQTRLEAELTRRESRMNGGVEKWIESRFAARINAYILLTIPAFYFGGFINLVSIPVLLVVCVLGIFHFQRNHISSLFVECGSIFIESLFFMWALSGFMPYGQLIFLFICFNLLFDFSPLPGAAGIAELAALFMNEHGIFWPLLVFHFFRLLPVLVLGPVYLARYKFSVADFFSFELIPAIKSCRRPSLGWAEEPMPPDAPYLSIVIPAYNEENRMPLYIEKIKEYMHRSQFEIEVIIVDDGSQDETAMYVEIIGSEDNRFKLIRQPRNMGKGAAVSRGIMESRGRYVVFADADGATPITELDKFIPQAEAGNEIVIASRNIPSDCLVSRERNFFRSIMGHVFYVVVNMLAVPGIRDTQCGFKLFRRDVARKLFSMTKELGWAFDVEILYLAQLFGYKIRETAVNWSEIDGSKINPLKDPLKMFLAIFRIRRAHCGFIRNYKAAKIHHHRHI